MEFRLRIFKQECLLSILLHVMYILSVPVFHKLVKKKNLECSKLTIIVFASFAFINNIFFFIVFFSFFNNKMIDHVETFYTKLNTAQTKQTVVSTNYGNT